MECERIEPPRKRLKVCFWKWWYKLVCTQETKSEDMSMEIVRSICGSRWTSRVALGASVMASGILMLPDVCVFDLVGIIVGVFLLHVCVKRSFEWVLYRVYGRMEIAIMLVSGVGCPYWMLGIAVDFNVIRLIEERSSGGSIRMAIRVFFLWFYWY